ncbi:MAG: PAS domain S-box protein [Pseudomonadota bacterium]
MDETFSLAETILEHISDAVIYADDTGTIMRWNPAAATLFGYSAAEALGQKLDLIIPPELREAHWRGFDAATSSGVMDLKGRPTLTRARHRNGHKLYIEMSFGLVKCYGGLMKCGAVAVARNAGERAQTLHARSNGGNGENGSHGSESA